MPKRDMEEALNLHTALLRLVSRPGGRNDPDGKRWLYELCALALRVVDDMEARVQIRAIENLAGLLFSDGGHVGIESGSLEGVPALKFQIHNALSTLRGRLE